MIARPLERVAQVADTVARGGLRSEVRVESEDEIGHVMRSLRDMNSSCPKATIRRSARMRPAVLANSESR